MSEDLADQWVQFGDLRMRFDGMHRRLDDPGRNRFYSDARIYCAPKE
jgi:hypothetical protein